MIAELRDELLSQITRRHKLRTPSTVNRYLAALSRAFTICIKELGWIKENPVLSIQRPKENKSRERFLAKNEITNLLSECKRSKSPHLYPIVLFALATGARQGEILHLRWIDVDLINGIAIFRDTKNGETRSVALSAPLIDCLIQERQKRIVSSTYIFPSNTGKKPVDISSAWKLAISRAGIRNTRFHDLRHTAASYLAMSGASTLEIAAILGHKTLAMVQRYSHLTTSATAKALFKMNEEIFGSQEKQEQNTSIHRIQKALKHMREINSNIADAIDLTIHTIFSAPSKLAGGGSTSAAIGCIWVDSRPHWDDQDILEFLIHETTHNLIFLDELCYTHYSSYPDIAKKENFAWSAILNKPRPLDKVFHSILVSVEVLMFREKHTGHPNQPHLHPPTEILLGQTIRSIDYLEENLHLRELLTQRALHLLQGCAQLIDPLKERIGGHPCGV